MRNFAVREHKKLTNFFRYVLFLASMLSEFSRINKKVGNFQTARGIKWIRSGFDSPAPNFVKWNVFAKWGSDGIWIESGTYIGESTEYLSKFASAVISIEPSSDLVDLAKKKFENNRNVSIVHGTSEQVLGTVLKRIENTERHNLNFWLDGHYSAGVTYLGVVECPVPDELSIIEQFIEPSTKITILIDDVRSFSRTGQTRSGYPSLTYLVNWADKNSMYWTIEHDIFIMTNRF